MAKISPVSIKYIIYAKFVAEGAVEKPDVIGAVFGQTEGLLGSDLEMRELQKEGKIGRVEVQLNTEGGSTSGEIEIPTALDKTETTLIAAALETIERIGPSNAKIQIDKIDDVRASKRDYILERAKKLMEHIQNTTPESRELKDNVIESSRIAKIQEYGTERLPCGDISGEELIIVEGRADVINLLRNGVNNVIGMNGTILPETIKELSYDKKVTLFIDGDRGGRLIAKNVSDNARVDYVAVAPDGKEVEELQGKEILICLRKRLTIGDYLKFNQERPSYNNSQSYNRDSHERRYRDYSERRPYRDSYHNRDSAVTASKEEATNSEPEPTLTEEKKNKIAQLYEEIANKKTALLLNKNLEIIKRTSSRIVSSTLEKSNDAVYAIVIDGSVVPAIIRAAEKAGCKHIAAKNFSFSEATPINLISL